MSDRPLPCATARAHSNIALIKYWGKRDPQLNLPAVGSISITLDGLYTDTTVVFEPALEHDHVELNGRVAPAERFTRFLDLVRCRAGIRHAARIVSANNFPTGAGLASSASGFAALALASCRAAALDPDPRALSILARQGSGSAARSIYGGIVAMHRGERSDGLDAFAECVLAADEWPLEVVVAITEHRAKTINSSIGMGATAERSDFYQAWLDHAERDLGALRDAVAARDFATLGELAEHSCLKMHGLMLSARPGLIYWNAATVAAMHAVRALRADGVPVFFTVDAGPQVKAVCAPGHAQQVAAALDRVEGVLETRSVGLGPAAFILE